MEQSNADTRVISVGEYKAYLVLMLRVQDLLNSPDFDLPANKVASRLLSKVEDAHLAAMNAEGVANRSKS